MRLNTSYDFRTDTRPGYDPDKDSPTLRRYHQALWSKPLPSGAMFELDAPKRGGDYLVYDSQSGPIRLSSDTAVPTFGTSVKHLNEQFPRETIERFHELQYSIGGMMVWPSTIVDGKQTINGAKGFRPRIGDRLDLTVECIRQHYAGATSPLADVLERYSAFFALFGDFDGYVEFFLLQDILSRNSSEVSFFLPFNNFAMPSKPQDLAQYREYIGNAVEFIEARNRRIDSLGIDIAE